MSYEFVQRQVTGFLAPGTSTSVSNPNQFDPSAYTWQVQDVYPSTVMKLDPGKYTCGTLTVAATSGTATVPLPGNYLTARRLAVFISSTATIKAVTVSPAHATSTVMVVAGTNQSGLLVFNERVTSITLSNVGATAATVSYSTWEYPADISDPDAWQGGVETIGTVST
jgi:hypothetical protein